MAMNLRSHRRGHWFKSSTAHHNCQFRLNKFVSLGVSVPTKLVCQRHVIKLDACEAHPLSYLPRALPHRQPIVLLNTSKQFLQ